MFPGGDVRPRRRRSSRLRSGFALEGARRRNSVWQAVRLALARCITKGQGVPQDYAEAYFWYYLAAASEPDASDTEQVAHLRDEAATHLAPADLSREQERARKWFDTRFEAHQAKP